MVAIHLWKFYRHNSQPGKFPWTISTDDKYPSENFRHGENCPKASAVRGAIVQELSIKNTVHEYKQDHIPYV